MIVVAGYIRLAPGQRDQAVTAATEMMRHTRQEPGCQTYEFSADLVDPDRFRIFEEWDSPESLAAHFQTDHMRAFQTRMAQVKIEEMEVKRYEVSSVGPVR